MKKTLFAVLALIGLCASSNAQVVQNAQAVKSVVQYKTTCSSTTIGLTAVELTGNTTSPANTAGISNIKVTNQDTVQTVCCGSASSVTCISGASTDMDPITPTTGQKNFLSWPISITQTWYCIATAAGTGIIKCLVR